jgi:tetratricopeptide (TPR) repeat protein
MKEKLMGAESADVAMTLNNLATLLKKQSKYEEAELMFRRSLAIFEQTLDPRDPKIITCLRNFAALLRCLKRYAEAVTLETRANATPA